MNVSRLDRQVLSQALDDADPNREHYLHLEEGSVWTFVFSESTDETRKRRGEVLDGLGTIYLRVPSRSTQEAYEEAEDFVESVRDVGVQESLFRALERKGSLKNFREAILQHADERQLWSAHRRERSERRLETFLRTLGVDPAPIPESAG
jgi:hypothetical protein